MSRLTYIGVAVLVLVVSSAIVVWSFGLNTQPSKSSIAPALIQPSPSPTIESLGIKPGIKPSDSGLKNEVIVTGFVYKKNDGAVMLTTDEEEVWSVVKRTPGQTVSLIVGGASKEPIEWSDIQLGLPIEIKTQRVVDNDLKVIIFRLKDNLGSSPSAEQKQ